MTADLGAGAWAWQLPADPPVPRPRTAPQDDQDAVPDPGAADTGTRVGPGLNSVG